MLRILIRIIATAGALLLMARYVPGISISSFYIAVIVALLWGVISFTLRPLLVLLTLPINLLTLGLFTFVINALLFWFLATFVAGFSVAGFVPALEGSFLLSCVGWILNALL